MQPGGHGATERGPASWSAVWSAVEASRGATSAVLLALIRAYQITVGPLFAGVCRFQPSCSRYTAEAIERHGPYRGVRLGARRLLSCRPFGGSGYDPVPDDRGSGAGSRPDRGIARSPGASRRRT